MWFSTTAALATRLVSPTKFEKYQRSFPDSGRLDRNVFREFLVMHFWFVRDFILKIILYIVIFDSILSNLIFFLIFDSIQSKFIFLLLDFVWFDSLYFRLVFFSTDFFYFHEFLICLYFWVIAIKNLIFASFFSEFRHVGIKGANNF